MSTLAEYPLNFISLAAQIKQWGLELGFDQIGITDIDLANAETRLKAWIDKGFHGEMGYMRTHGSKRTRPDELIPGTLRVISARMNYLPESLQATKATLNNQNLGFIARYAVGRDYHKIIRKRLEKLAQKISLVVDKHSYRVFCDSAPVMEKPLAEKAGLGFIGKHTNLINTQHGSYFFLGSLYTNLPLPVDVEAKPHCGSCEACIKVCPTQAIVAPYQLDARRCISYLTIEFRGSIPEELRSQIGNRIYGCDDCQLFCPWNKFAKISAEPAFRARYGLEASSLIELFALTESKFIELIAGSAMKRISYECWLRNIAVALGNAPYHPLVIEALNTKSAHNSELVREHVAWALQAQLNKSKSKLDCP